MSRILACSLMIVITTAASAQVVVPVDPVAGAAATGAVQGGVAGVSEPDKNANPVAAGTTGASQGAATGALQGAVGGALVGGPAGASAGAAAGAAKGAAEGGAAGTAKALTSGAAAQE
ncbi:MAG: hypothetical protein Q8M24_11605 [Pseudolabrys sp.]|nr:hypothetical protein [Pseudolabrys sp.]MDP2296093.1 hypothetical protein [Pseudolabrys sp.]